MPNSPLDRRVVDKITFDTDSEDDLFDGTAQIEFIDIESDRTATTTLTRAAGVSITAGCLGSEDTVARCASQGEGSDSQHLRRIAPIEKTKQIALGIIVSTEAVEEDQYDTVEVRNTDGTLISSIPLEPNRDMNRLEQDDFPVLQSTDGELYAVPLERPPVHGEFTASIISTADETIASETTRFNCYSEDGSLP